MSGLLPGNSMITVRRARLKLLETGIYIPVRDIAAAEKVKPYYVIRVLRLTLLAPEIVEVILDGRQEPEITRTRFPKLGDIGRRSGRPSVTVAGVVGERHALYHCGDRHCRKDHQVLYGPCAAADAAAGD